MLDALTPHSPGPQSKEELLAIYVHSPERLFWMRTAANLGVETITKREANMFVLIDLLDAATASLDGDDSDPRASLLRFFSDFREIFSALPDDFVGGVTPRAVTEYRAGVPTGGYRIEFVTNARSAGNRASGTDLGGYVDAKEGGTRFFALLAIAFSAATYSRNAISGDMIDLYGDPAFLDRMGESLVRLSQAARPEAFGFADGEFAGIESAIEGKRREFAAIANPVSSEAQTLRDELGTLVGDPRFQAYSLFRSLLAPAENRGSLAEALSRLRSACALLRLNRRTRAAVPA